MGAIETGPIFIRLVSYLLLACWAKFELRRPKLFRLVVDDRLLGELESDLQKVKMRLEAPVSPIHKTHLEFLKSSSFLYTNAIHFVQNSFQWRYILGCHHID